MSLTLSCRFKKYLDTKHVWLSWAFEMYLNKPYMYVQHTLNVTEDDCKRRPHVRHTENPGFPPCSTWSRALVVPAKISPPEGPPVKEKLKINLNINRCRIVLASTWSNERISNHAPVLLRTTSCLAYGRGYEGPLSLFCGLRAKECSHATQASYRVLWVSLKL